MTLNQQVEALRYDTKALEALRYLAVAGFASYSVEELFNAIDENGE